MAKAVKNCLLEAILAGSNAFFYSKSPVWGLVFSINTYIKAENKPTDRN